MAIFPQVKSPIVRNKDLDQTNQLKTLSSIQIQFLRIHNPHIGRSDFITIRNHHAQSQTPIMSEVTAHPVLRSHLSGTMRNHKALGRAD